MLRWGKQNHIRFFCCNSCCDTTALFNSIGINSVPIAIAISHLLVMPAYKLLTTANDPGIFTSRLAKSKGIIFLGCFCTCPWVCGCTARIICFSTPYFPGNYFICKRCICCLGAGAYRKLSLFIWYFLLHMRYRMSGFQRELKSHLVSSPLSEVGNLQRPSSSFQSFSKMIVKEWHGQTWTSNVNSTVWTCSSPLYLYMGPSTGTALHRVTRRVPAQGCEFPPASHTQQRSWREPAVMRWQEAPAPHQAGESTFPSLANPSYHHCARAKFR